MGFAASRRAFPTLEMRVTDVCPLIDDGIAIAALFLCILRMLYRLRRQNQRWRHYRRSSWREPLAGAALRHRPGPGRFRQGRARPLPRLCSRSCSSWSPRMPPISAAPPKSRMPAPSSTRGTSADRQLARYEAVKALGGSEQAALVAVVDGIIEETMMPPTLGQAQRRFSENRSAIRLAKAWWQYHHQHRRARSHLEVRELCHCFFRLLVKSNRERWICLIHQVQRTVHQYKGVKAHIRHIDTCSPWNAMESINKRLAHMSNTNITAQTPSDRGHSLRTTHSEPSYNILYSSILRHLSNRRPCPMPKSISTNSCHMSSFASRSSTSTSTCFGRTNNFNTLQLHLLLTPSPSRKSAPTSPRGRGLKRYTTKINPPTKLKQPTTT